METTTQGFTDLGLTDALCATVDAVGYLIPTPVQREAIPHVLAGRDVLGCAQTGTGKTAAFALPIIQRLLADPERARTCTIGALVLSPTRELAAQIGETFGQMARGTKLRHAVIFGGVGQGPQVNMLRRGVDVLVATPGRLLDLMQQREVDLRKVQVFVLDEADRMLDMGFIHDVRKVVAVLPKQRQNLMFSATMPSEIEALAGRILVNPIRVEVDPVASTGAPIEQSVYFVDRTSKLRLLSTLLRGDAIESALVFTRTKHGANRLTEGLLKAGFSAAAIHGNKSQSAREKALSAFKRGEIRIVVATDIAARGIDVKDLSHVINFDMPVDAETYVHRVGRTGRAGQSGIALSFCSPDERPDLLAIERLVRKRIAAAELPRELGSAAPRAPQSQQAYGQGQHAQPRQQAQQVQQGAQAAQGPDADLRPNRPLPASRVRHFGPRRRPGSSLSHR